MLSSTFKDLYTGDVIGADIEANWLKSRGGDDAYHEAFTEELQKVQGNIQAEFGALFGLLFVTLCWLQPRLH